MNSLDIYRLLLYIRKAEEKIASVYSLQHMRCPVHLSIGQEGVAVGVCSNLSTSDIVFSSHRSHAHYLAKGGNLQELYAELLGKKNGCSKGQGGSMHLTSKRHGFFASTSIVAGTLPVAVGSAIAQKMNASSNITVAFIGDGGIEEGVFWESINIANRFDAPIVICIENNQYACYSSIQQRRKEIDFKKFSSALNVPYYYFEEGWNTELIQNKMGDIISSLKRTPQAVICEFNVYRRYEHCGHTIDDHLGYRPIMSNEQFNNVDPIYKYELMIKEKFGDSCVKEQYHDIAELVESSYVNALSDESALYSLGEFLNYNDHSK